MTVALYIRVSTDEQATQGFSLESQRQRLEAFCASQGWADFEVFMDDGYTGTNLDRPALKRLLRAAQRKRISGVIVYRLDRLSRRQRDVLYLLEDVFDANDIAFRSATEPFDTSTPLGRAMLGILAVFAQLERDTIIERTKSGMRQRVAKGLWHGANYPFGYVMNQETGVLEIVPEEAALVRQVYAKFLAGESRANIARWLQKRTTARDINTLFMRRLLTRQTYVGRLVLNGEVYEGQHEPIIDVETFERVQEKMRKAVIPRGGERNLLTGFLRCGVCGDHMSYWLSAQKKAKGDGYHRYMRVICNNKRAKATNCASKSILARDVEAAVAHVIQGMPVNASQYAVPQIPDDQESLISRLEHELEDISAQRKRLLDAVQAGALPIDAVKERFDQLEASRKAIQEQLDDIEDIRPEIDAESFVSVLRQTQTVWNDIPWEDQRILLKTIVKTVRVYPDKHVELELNL